MNPAKTDIFNLYRDGVGAIFTSLACSVCTCVVSQCLLAATGSAAHSPEMQSAVSVSIFVVGYWIVYFAIRGRVQGYLSTIGIGASTRICDVGRGARLFFVCASEIFWIVSLGIANLGLLRAGYSAQAAAALAQWGINLAIWLPLLPVWEWFATDYMPKKIVVCVRRGI
jgi:hypothetical protein